MRTGDDIRRGRLGHHRRLLRGSCGIRARHGNDRWRGTGTAHGGEEGEHVINRPAAPLRLDINCSRWAWHFPSNRRASRRADQAEEREARSASTTAKAELGYCRPDTVHSTWSYRAFLQVCTENPRSSVAELSPHGQLRQMMLAHGRNLWTAACDLLVTLSAFTRSGRSSESGLGILPPSSVASPTCQQMIRRTVKYIKCKKR